MIERNAETIETTAATRKLDHSARPKEPSVQASEKFERVKPSGTPKASKVEPEGCTDSWITASSGYTAITENRVTTMYAAMRSLCDVIAPPPGSGSGR